MRRGFPPEKGKDGHRGSKALTNNLVYVSARQMALCVRLSMSKSRARPLAVAAPMDAGLSFRMKIGIRPKNARCLPWEHTFCLSPVGISTPSARYAVRENNT